MKKTKMNYNDLIEEKEELQEIEIWLDKIQKTIVKIEKITLIVSVLMAAPFILCGLCIFPNILIHFDPMIPLAIYGAGGMLMSGIAIMLLNPTLSLMKFINKNSLKNTDKKIAELEKTTTKSINREKKNSNLKPLNHKQKSQVTSPKYSYKPIQKSESKPSIKTTSNSNQTVNKNSKQKSQVTPPKYSYKPIQKSEIKSSFTNTSKPKQTVNKNTEFDPKNHIKLVNGKLVWIDNPESINKPKKRILSK